MKTMALLFLGVFSSVETFAGLGNGMVFWLRGGKDNADSGNIGYLDQYEFPDALRASSGGQSWTDMMYSYINGSESRGYVPFGDYEVIEPATGRSLGVRTCLDFNQNGLPDKTQIACLPNAASHAFPTNSIGWSFFIRFRPHRSPVTPTSGFVLANVLDHWSSGGCGALVTLSDSVSGKALGEEVQLSIRFGGTNKSFSLPDASVMKTNLWTDLLVSVKTNAASVYLVREGGALYKSTVVLGFEQDLTKTGNIFLGAMGVSLSDCKAYHGCVQIADFAYWRRGISEDEALDMMQCPLSDYARLGVENGSSGEFTAQGSGASTPGSWGEWRDLPGTLSAGRTMTFSFTLPENYEKVNQILSLTAVPGSPVCPLPVKVNGTSVGDLEFSGVSQKAYLLLTSENLVVGDNTIKIGAGEASVEVDTISVGGGWQLGVQDDAGTGKNNGLAYFSTNVVGMSSTTNVAMSLRTYDYWGTQAKDGSWSHLTGRNLETFRFRVPDSFLGGANACRFTFRPLMARGESTFPAFPDGQQYMYGFYVNGVRVCEKQAPARRAVTLKFDVPMNTFATSRECVISVVNETEPWYNPLDYDYSQFKYGCYYWNQVDYFSFEPLNRLGMIMIMR